MPKRLSRLYLASSIAGSALLYSALNNPVFADTSRSLIHNGNGTDFYISGAGGATLLGTAGRLGIGYDFGVIRTEFEYTKSGGDVYNQIPINVETYSQTGTLFWDIPLGFSTYPSVGTGLGSTNLNIHGRKNIWTYF